MVDVAKLIEFVENYLLLYGIGNESYHIEKEENGEQYSTIFLDHEIKEDVVSHMLLLTGLTREELFSMKKEVMEKYYQKYSFFMLDAEFNQKYRAESHFLDTEKIADSFYIGILDRYDVKDLKKRIILKTKEINRVIEGTYHRNAIPVGLCYSTEWTMSFPKYHELITSLFDMINRYKELFFKAIGSDLEDEEIREMNFLAYSLDMRDLIQRDICLHYNNTIKLRDIYYTENLKDFLSYVKIGRLEKTKYWRCEEFLKDKRLAQSYISMYPEAFFEIRQYLMRTENFSCWFYWSDNVPDEWKEEAEKSVKTLTVYEESAQTRHENYIMSLDDNEYNEYMHNIKDNEFDFDIFNDEPYDPDQVYDMSSPNWLIQEEELDAKVDNKDFLGTTYVLPEDEKMFSGDERLVHLYIKKQKEEYFDNSRYFAQIRKIIQPAEKGGFSFPERECASDKLRLKDGQLFDRRAARLQAMTGGV